MRKLSFLVFASSIAAACGGAGDASPTDSTAPASGNVCERDPQLLEAPIDCVRDVDCPCGAACDLGRCGYACAADMDCPTGQVCDVFGTCSAERSGRPAGPVKAEVEGRIEVAPLGLSVPARRPEGVFTVRAAGGPVREARILGADGIEVSCDGGATFGGDCRVGPLDPADGLAAVRLRVRATTRPHFDVRVVGPHGRASVDVRIVDAPPARRPLSGRYRGTARIVGAGLTHRAASAALPEAMESAAIPVEAFVHAEAPGRPVELFDALGALFGAEGAVGALSGPPSAPALELPSFRVLEAADVRLGAAGPVERGLSGLSVQLGFDVFGVTEAAGRPFLEVDLQLSRVGDVPEDRAAPAVPAPAPGTEGRLIAPLGVERAAEAALAGLGLPESGAAEDVLARLCTPDGASAPGTWSRTVASAWSQEPTCDGGAPLGVRFTETTGTWRLERELARCAEDAAHAHAEPAPGLGDRPCFDGPRLLAAAAAGLTTARARAAGQPVPPDTVAEALAHRSLQHWLEAHTFLASQTHQATRLNRLLGASEQIAWPADPETLLGRAAAGFDALLHPRIAGGLAYIAPTVLVGPDPRPRVFPGFRPTFDQPHHTFDQVISVTLARALATQIAAVRARLERRRFETRGRAELETLATGLARRAVVLYALARGLVDAAYPHAAGPIDWMRDWARAEAALGQALDGLAKDLEAFRQRENPLGIDDALDLPLYQAGRQVAASERFSAVSEYLLGPPGQDLATAWVPSQLQRAEAAFASARRAVQSNLDRDFDRDLERAARERRLEAIRRRYGEGIVSLCGDPTWDAYQVLDFADGIDPDTCFVVDGCTEGAELRAGLDPAELAYELCLHGRAERRRSAGASGLPARIVAGEVHPVHVEARGDVFRVRLSDGTVEELSPEARAEIRRGRLEATASPDAFAEDHAACDAARQAILSDRPHEAPASCQRTAECPVGQLCAGEGRCTPTPRDDGPPRSCFRGGLGELALSVQAAARDVEIARSELKDQEEAYDRAMEGCLIAQMGGDRLEAALAAHHEAVDAFAIGKLSADIAANTAAAVKDTAASVNGNVAASITTGVAAGVEAAARSTSDGLQLAIDRLERAHAENVLELENEVRDQVCFNAAELHLVGVRTAGLRIQRASLDLARQLVELENQKVQLASLLAEGQDALGRESARAVAPTEMDFWLSEDVARMETALRGARRALYLAALAVEYEQQLSFAEKADILGADRPAELRAIHDGLQSLRATGLVAGAAPGNRVAVVSLRRHLLQLADRSGLSRGWHALSDVDQLRALLTAPENAVYDAQGRYRGQEIRFTLSPLAALGLGDDHGVAILSGVDCAERLWAVSASLTGQGLTSVPDSAVTDVVVRKRNTFYSQWCTRAGDRASFQVASTRPLRNLFLDPQSSFGRGLPQALPRADLSAVDATRAFTSARIRAFFGVSRGTLERDDDLGGASVELAGRGLYGDYALFFPAETLALAGQEGLRLENVEDVLLRFDYVSAAPR